MGVLRHEANMKSCAPQQLADASLLPFHPELVVSAVISHVIRQLLVHYGQAIPSIVWPFGDALEELLSPLKSSASNVSFNSSSSLMLSGGSGLCWAIGDKACILRRPRDCQGPAFTFLLSEWSSMCRDTQLSSLSELSAAAPSSCSISSSSALVPDSRSKCCMPPG